jgi:hypothetical protein
MARLMQYAILSLSMLATDDAIIIGPLTLVQNRMNKVADDYVKC